MSSLVRLDERRTRLDKERFEQLEERVKQLEQEVKLLKQQGEMEKHIIPSKMVDRPKVSAEQRKTEANEKKVHVEKKASVDWEHLIGRVWLPRIFIFVLLMGLIWGFKVAVDYGVLTEPVRVALGFGVAIGLYFLGERQLKQARQSLGKSLLTGAIGILILTTFAMNVLYSMVPTMIAFSLNIIWVVLGLFLAHRHRSQVMAILMAFIGYLIPFLVAGSGNIFVAVLYEFIFYAVLVYYSINREFKRLFYIASILLHLVYLVFLMLTFMYDQYVLKGMALGAIVQHAIIFYSVYRSKFNKLFPIPLLFTSFIVTTFWVKLGTLQDDHLYVLYLFVVSLGYAFVVKKKKDQKDFISVALSIATFGAFLLLLQIFKDDGNALLASFLIEGVFALYLGFRFKAVFQQVIGGFVYFIGTVMILFTFIEELISVETLMWLLFILTLYGLIYLAKTFYKENQSVQIIMTFAAIYGHILFYIQLPTYEALLSLECFAAFVIILSLGGVYVWTKEGYKGIKAVYLIIIGINVLIQLAFITDLVRLLSAHLSDNITMMLISFSWALYATISVIVGVVYNKKEIRLFGIALLILTLFKLILVDLQYVTIVVRAILFIGLGVIGIVLSRLLYVKK